VQQHRRAEKGPKYSQQCEGNYCPQRDIEIISSPQNGVTHSSVHPIAFDHPPAYCNYRSLVAIILVYLPLLRDGFSLRKKNLSPKHFHRAPWPPSQRTMTAKSTSYPRAFRHVDTLDTIAVRAKTTSAWSLPSSSPSSLHFRHHVPLCTGAALHSFTTFPPWQY